MCLHSLTVFPTLSPTKRGSTSIMHKHLTTQHAGNLHVYIYFDMLFSNGGNESMSDIDNGIGVTKFFTFF